MRPAREFLHLSNIDARNSLSKEEFRRYQKCQEICSLGGLEEFKYIIADGVDKTAENNIIIRISETDLFSNGPEYTSNREILLPVKNMEKGVGFLWSFFHEIGHGLDPTNPAEKSVLDSEKFAWNTARQLLTNFFDEHGHKDSFEERANYCLGAYEEIDKIIQKIKSAYSRKFGKPLESTEVREFAKICGLEDYHLLKILFGRTTPSKETMSSICKGLDIDVSELF